MIDALRGSGRVQAIGLLLLALALPAAGMDARVFLACWLCASWYLTGLMLGALSNLWIHRLTGGRWGALLQPVGLHAARRLPLALLLFLPVLAGSSLLYPWAADPQGWSRALARPGFVTGWLQPELVWIRLALYAALWCWLARPASMGSPGRAAASLVLYLFSGTLAAVDLLMTLQPGWSSAAFGLVVLAGQALGGAALCTLWLACHAPAELTQAKPGTPPLARDLGNLLLMWVMLWAYLAYMEFLIIWAEDLPREIVWYLPRLQTGWSGVGLALVLGLLALPLLALLQRGLKDRPRALACIAAWTLLMQLLNCAWLVLPSVSPHSLLGGWLLPQLTLGMALLLFGAGRAGLALAPGSGTGRPDSPEARRVRP